MRVRAITILAAALLFGVTHSPVVSHGEIPDADAACTGNLLLGDDLPSDESADRPPSVAHVVSARAEILDESGSAIGTLYLDQAGIRYVTLGVRGRPLATALGLGGRRVAEPGEPPERLDASRRIDPPYRLAACR